MQGTSSPLARLLSYTFNVRMPSYRDYLELFKAMLSRLAERISSEKPLESHLNRAMIVKTWDGFVFFVRPKSPDFYAIVVAEHIELEKWFKPLAKGVVVDVGAYIGAYTVRACRQADVVVAVEPHPFNFAVLSANVKLNNCTSDKIMLINKVPLFVPIESDYVFYSHASLKQSTGRNDYETYWVRVEPLDEILSELNISQVDFLKIDIEDYVTEALPGMLNTLKKTRYLFIELWNRNTIKTFKALGFKPIDYSGPNYLFRKL